MALRLLLDEQMSPEVAVQIEAKRADIPIESAQTWRGGVLRGKPDDQVLRAAREAGLTLVSYDVSTITPLLVEWAAQAESHAGVIFIDNRTLAQNDFGGQVAALIAQWDIAQAWEWTNVVLFLRPAGR